MGSQHEDSEMVVLSSSECYQMLGARQIGRLGVVAEHYPLIIPVNYALDHDVVVIRTEPGSIVARVEHANVTFQVDEFNPAKASGGAFCCEARPNPSPPNTAQKSSNGRKRPVLCRGLPASVTTGCASFRTASRAAGSPRVRTCNGGWHGRLHVT